MNRTEDAYVAWYQNQATPEQRSFADDIIDLLEGRRSGHMGNWIWGLPKSKNDPVNGPYWWNLFSNSDQYYILRDDIALYKNFAQAIVEICHDVKTVVEYGPGSSTPEKTFEILSKSKKLNKVIYVDINREFLTQTRMLTQAHFKHLAIETVVSDFTKTVPATSKRTLVIVAGGTVMNFYNLPELLHCLVSGMKAGGYLLVTYDTNLNAEMNVKTYTHPAFDELGKGTWYRAIRDLPLNGLDISSLQRKPTWSSEDAAIRFNTWFNRNMSINLCGKSLEVNADRLYWSGSSYRYSEVVFAKYARMAGGEWVRTFKIPNSTVRLALFAYG